MSSPDPPDHQSKHGFRRTMRSKVKSVKSALSGPTNPHLPTGQPDLLAAPGIGSRLLSVFSRSTPALIPGPPPAGSGERTPIPLLEPSTQATAHEPGNYAWYRLKNTLGALESAVELFPPLKSAVGAFIGCLDVVQAAASNRADYEELAEEFQSMADMLKQYASVLESEPSNGSIANMAECMMRQVGEIKQKERRGTIGHLLEASHDQEDVIRRYRQVERLFRQLQCDLSMRSRNDVKKQLETTLLRGMSPVDDAKYDSSYSTTIRRRGCTAETREAIHRTLQEWTTNPKGEKIYWMNGMAGTGKTTIAYSFCEWLESTNRLGASFFCSRISSTCRSLNQIVPTLAYQLARFSPAFRSKLCTALNDDPDAGKLNVMQQFEKLINQPMLKAKGAIPDNVVIVIDALDECDDAYSVRLLLDLLLRFAEDLPLKFFVASRPEHAIRDRMISQGGASRSIVHLHDIEASIVEGDIKKYLTEALCSMSPPPTPEQITMLAKRSRNLFIYAATVARYIYPEDAHVDSSARLNSMLAAISAFKGIAKNKYEDLDRLYTTVLSVAFNTRLDDDEKESMRRVLWTIVCAREPMTMATIGSLSNLTERQVGVALRSLRSVVHVPEDNSLISTLHASFPEYMLDKTRSKEFYCNESEANTRMVYRFFEIMKEDLRFNICGLKSSYLTDDQVEDLDAQVARCISPTLSYACRYWGTHLLLAPALADIRKVVLEFLCNQLLFWMEVLNLSRCIGIGAPMIQQAQTWLRMVLDTSDETQKQFSDARNFVTWFAANPCSGSTPHIYVSALPLYPKSNWVYQKYSQRLKGLANIGISHRDEAVLAIWHMASQVDSVTISPDGDLIASGSGDGDVHIYDIHTGAMIVGPLQGHTDGVYSVAFSLDGSLIASGSDNNTVIIWDAHTGTKSIGPLRKHTKCVWSVAFSPDGNHIVSGSEDESVIVWDIHSGDIVVGPLWEHSGQVYSVAFSPDGQIIASGSADGTIRLWNASTGVPMDEPLKGHGDEVNRVVFSPDGTHLASCSNDRTIRIWDVQTGMIVGSPFQGHQGKVWSLACSSDGSQLVSGGKDDDPTIIVWDMRTGSTVVGPLRGHTEFVRSVAFTPDSTRVVSCSNDDTIRIWDIQPKDKAADEENEHESSVGPVAFFPGCTRFASCSSKGSFGIWDMHTGSMNSYLFERQAEPQTIHSVAVSPEGTHVAAITNDFVIRLWNVHAGSMNMMSLEGHTGLVNCLSFFPDGSHLCSGSSDSTIILWDISIGRMVGQPYQWHTSSVLSVTYSPDGTCIASGAEDGSVLVWDPITGTLIHTLSGLDGSASLVAFSPDGNQIASGGVEGKVFVWDAHVPSDPAVLDCSIYGSVSCMDFSPNGTRLIVGSESRISVFDTQTTQVVSTLFMTEYEKLRWVGFSSDGDDIISVSVPFRSSKLGSATAIERLREDSNIFRVWRTGALLPHNADLSNLHSITEYWSYTPDGRILSPDGFVMWVPPDLIPYLKVESKSHYNPFVLSTDGVIDIGYKDLCIGERWAECYVHKD